MEDMHGSAGLPRQRTLPVASISRESQHSLAKKSPSNEMRALTCQIFASVQTFHHNAVNHCIPFASVLLTRRPTRIHAKTTSMNVKSFHCSNCIVSVVRFNIIKVLLMTSSKRYYVTNHEGWFKLYSTTRKSS